MLRFLPLIFFLLYYLLTLVLLNRTVLPSYILRFYVLIDTGLRPINPLLKVDDNNNNKFKNIDNYEARSLPIRLKSGRSPLPRLRGRLRIRPLYPVRPKYFLARTPGFKL